MPSVNLMILTYKRMEYSKRTICALANNITCNDHELSVHIADDCSGEGYLEELTEYARSTFGPRTLKITSSQTRRNEGYFGYGANYNEATRVVHDFADYILPIEDDWELTRELPIDSLIADMETAAKISSISNPNYGYIDCIRLGYIGYTQEIRARIVQHNSRAYLYFLPDSPEPHVFAGHPRIEHRNFQRTIGPWPAPPENPGLSAGQTEWEVSHRFLARINVAWPMWLIPNIGGDLFVHIGTERTVDING